MRIGNKKMFITAAIVLLLAAAVGIIIFDRDTNVDLEKKIELAGEYLANSDYDNAIAIYNGVLADDDNCSEAYVGLAEAYYIKGNTEKSLEILEKGLNYSDDEDAVIEKINTLFPDYDIESFWDEDDEYYAEVPDEIEFETEDESTASETEIVSVSEEVTDTETTAVPETEDTIVTTTTEAPIVTTVITTVPTTTPVTTTTAPVTTTSVPVTTTVAPHTTTETTTTTTVATTREPEAIVVEDLTMLTVSEARAWCERNNLSLSVIGGNGEIISQSPAPGSIVIENSEIIVSCE